MEADVRPSDAPGDDDDEDHDDHETMRAMDDGAVAGPLPGLGRASAGSLPVLCRTSAGPPGSGPQRPQPFPDRPHGAGSLCGHVVPTLAAATASIRLLIVAPGPQLERR